MSWPLTSVKRETASEIRNEIPNAAVNPTLALIFSVAVEIIR